MFKKFLVHSVLHLVFGLLASGLGIINLILFTVSQLKDTPFDIWWFWGLLAAVVAVIINWIVVFWRIANTID